MQAKSTPLVEVTLAGRFRLVARLGEGAIGEVYEAVDLELEEQVAVKVLRPEIARDAEVLYRFKREIQLARKVTHPNVCRTFELFHHRDEGGTELAFVTMELLRGETLEERLLRAGRMTPAEALPLIAQMAAGLHAAHQAGVVHRDFKSGNVMLTPGPDGPRAVVTDFGIAWSSSAAASLTRAGTLIGSPAYMAPEQVRSEAVTPATDVYALGIVLYEMVTGSLPFSADSVIGTAIKRLREPPTLPRVHAPDLEPRWERVILRCLEAAPADRFATPLEVAQALAAPLGKADGARTAPHRLRDRAGLAIGAAAAFAGLALLGWLAWQRLVPSERPAALPRPAVAVLGFENLSRNPEAAYIETSLVRMLPGELAAGERLRLVPSEQVDRARRDLALGVTGGGLARDTLARLHTRLGADYVITGSYFAGQRLGASRVRCDVTLQDAVSGEVVASIVKEETEGDLLDLVDALGAEIRARLGAGDLSAAERSAARAARPANVQAARLYAEGLEQLSRFEAAAASRRLAKASRADPGNALIHADLAAAWEVLGYQARAQAEAREAFARSAGLGFEPHQRIEARFYETAAQWDRAAAIYRALWARHPDDLEHGLRLARAEIRGGDNRGALATVASLRRARNGDDPRVDLAEAEAALRLGEHSRGLAAAVKAQHKGESQGSPLVAAWALHFEGTALRLLGRLPEALAASERAASLFRQTGDLASAATALNNVGSVLAQQGDLERARRTFEEIAGIGATIGNEEARGLGLTQLGMTLSNLGDLAAARERYGEALALFRRTGSKNREAATSANLARVYQRLGERTEARAMYGTAASTFHALGDRSHEAGVLANLADLALEEGDLPTAWEQGARALALYREIGETPGAAAAQGGQGLVLALRGDLPAAERELTAAAAGLDAAGAKLAAARQRIELAGVLVDAGRAAAGEALAQSALAALGDRPTPVDEVAARTVLATAALAQGQKDRAAAQVARSARVLAACASRTVHLQAAIAAARVHAAAGQAPEATAELRAAADEAMRLGLRPLALEARLALAEIAAGSRGGASARGPLEAVTREAAAAGFGGIAEQARRALSRPRAPS